MRSQTIELYFKNERLLAEISWKWNKLTNVPFEELFSEAKISFFENLKKWNPDRAKLTTWLYLTTNTHLQNFSKKYHTISPNYEEYDFEKICETTPSKTEEEEKTDILKLLPEEFKEITKEILKEGKELSKEELTNVLRKKGWKWKKIWRYFKEMKKILKHI